MTSFQTLDYLRREAALGKREDFERFLNLVPDVPAQAGDELPSKETRARSIMAFTPPGQKARKPGSSHCKCARRH